MHAVFGAVQLITVFAELDDDSDFVRKVEFSLNRLINTFTPGDVYVVKIDSWFDFKWQRFSGKQFGAIGTWHQQLRIPPFVPERVVFERHFTKYNSGYVEQTDRHLHISQRSDFNLSRKINQFSSSAVFLWYSGATGITNRGSIMFYGLKDDTESSWYISVLRKQEWQLCKTRDISKSEAASLID